MSCCSFDSPIKFLLGPGGCRMGLLFSAMQAALVSEARSTSQAKSRSEAVAGLDSWPAAHYYGCLTSKRRGCCLHSRTQKTRCRGPGHYKLYGPQRPQFEVECMEAHGSCSFRPVCRTKKRQSLSKRRDVHAWALNIIHYKLP